MTRTKAVSEHGIILGMQNNPPVGFPMNALAISRHLSFGVGLQDFAM